MITAQECYLAIIDAAQVRVRSYTRKGKPVHAYTRDMADRLLAIGGKMLLRVDEHEDGYIPVPDVNRRGRLFPTGGTRFVLGGEGECHSNVAKMLKFGSPVGYIKRPLEGVQVATGWALNEGGTWVKHSWGVLNGRIIETTRRKRLKYFGVLLNTREAREFMETNLT